MSAKRVFGGALLLLLLIASAAALADKLILNDGTVLEGTVIKQEDKYWVKTTDGQTRTVPLADVKTLQKGSGSSSSGAPGPSSPGLTTKTLTGDIGTAQRRANAVDTPMAAVAIWQEYIDSKPPPSPENLKTARDELEKWKKMSTDGAEKINGRWVTGLEYQTLMKKVANLSKEAMQALVSNQSLKGKQKLEEARKLYPNSFQVNFLLGYLDLLSDDYDKARANFESVLRLKPKLPEAMGNLALIAWRKQRYGEAIKMMDDAAKNGDNPEIAFNLNSMINSAPEPVRKSAIVKTAEEDAKLLAAKYHIDQSKARGGLMLIRLYDENSEGRGRSVMTGSGFIIASDGLILTNRHVVKDAKTYLVMLNDNKQKSAEVVVIDDEQDLALLRLKDPGKSLPTVKLAPADTPADGAECTVIGYPMVDRLGGSPKITRGIVSSSSSGPKVLGMGGRNQETDVTVDAKVNPGNSGGPIIDRFGNVMAIVAMKSLASETEDSYGMGISAGRIRKFLAKNHIDAPKGEAVGSNLSSEEIAAKIEPSAVLILATH